MSRKTEIIDAVFAAMQSAEEAQGLTGFDYIDAMQKIADEATRRAVF